MKNQYSVQLVQSFQDIKPYDWSNLITTSRKTRTEYYNPFISYSYLSSLELSKSAIAETGWLPNIILLKDENSQLIGAVPGYIKSHSQGEYVFDHSWADALERAGGDYYPKLQCSVPFTPATTPKLLLSSNIKLHDANNQRTILSQSLQQVTDHYKLSSAHLTFIPKHEADALSELDYLIRTDQQFHFINQNYRDHEDFLDQLSSRKRKDLRKERATALENGITIDWLLGTDLTEEIWDQFYEFYTNTSNKKWGRPYLTREFFSLISQTMPNDILLVMAKRAGRYIAGAINFLGNDTVFGRHWGCIEEHPYLHFEVCYHQAIDYALVNKFNTVEAGAQGSHKLARGYTPVTTYSAHYIRHEGLKNAIADYLVQERKEVSEVQSYLVDHSPFRKGS